MYSINVTGYIPQQKTKEFKQHMRQLISQQNEETMKFSILQDMMNEDLYQVKVSFHDKESMFSFMNSEYYAMISGSFRVLGLLREKCIVEYSETTNGNSMDKDNGANNEKQVSIFRYSTIFRDFLLEQEKII